MKDGKHTPEEMDLAYRMMRGLMPMRERVTLKDDVAKRATERRADQLKLKRPPPR